MSDKRHHGHFVHENMPGMFTELEPGIDRRSRRTRQALHQALIRLIVERGYDEITVGDIADAADSGRSTFYAHFTDKDDLLRSAGDYLKRVLVAGVTITGKADHGVSEAIYFNDPDGNGVEIYRDRPEEEWPRGPDGTPIAFNHPLDLEALLAEA